MHLSCGLDSGTPLSIMGIVDRVHPLFTRRITEIKNLIFPRESKLRTTIQRSLSHTTVSSSSAKAHSLKQEVVIAIGSNVGDRIQNFNEALRLLKSSGVQITRHGCLYETEPAYVTDQPLFLNSAVRGITELGPIELLQVLKQIEKQLGRATGIRYGPRSIDLDILFYGSHKVDSEALTIPHARLWERPFVLAPLIDLLGTSSTNDDTETIWHSFSGCSGGLFEFWRRFGGEKLIGREGLRRVLPIGGQLWDWSTRTHVMGVLNLTPDSFSDGGKFRDVEYAVSRVQQLFSEGADIVDIGAQSTRPFARKLSAEEELQRLIPVLEALMRIPKVEGKLLSVDTFHAQVASEAVKRGVHIVNDVCGGRLDPNILSVVGELGVPYIIMHMRGDPCTMQSEENLHYSDVCEEVASELCARVREAELSGIPLWRIIIDPGIGFAKKKEQNLEILMGLPFIKTEIAKRSMGASHTPLLIGPSRKRFLGEICGRADATKRDPATCAAITAGILGGANIIRVHNVEDNLDAAKVSDALLKSRRE